MVGMFRAVTQVVRTKFVRKNNRFFVLEATVSNKTKITLLLKVSTRG